MQYFIPQTHPSVHHGQQAVVAHDNSGEGIGVAARGTQAGSVVSAYQFVIWANKHDTTVDTYTLERVVDNNRTVLSSGSFPAAIGAGTVGDHYRLRIQVENNTFSSRPNVYAFMGNSDAIPGGTDMVFVQLSDDSSPYALDTGNRSGTVGLSGLSPANYWEFKSIDPETDVYYDPVDGTQKGLGTIDDPCSDMAILTQCVITSKHYNGTTTVRVNNDGDMAGVATLIYDRHRGTSWNDPGLIISSWNDRRSLTGTGTPPMFNIIGPGDSGFYADYIWFKGLNFFTDDYGVPNNGVVIQGNSTNVRVTGCDLALGKTGQTQSTNRGITMQGDEASIYAEYSYIHGYEGQEAENAIAISGVAGDVIELTLDHVIFSDTFGQVVQLFGDWTCNSYDVDHCTFVDCSGAQNAFVVNFGVGSTAGNTYTVKNSLFANVNTSEMTYGYRHTNSGFTGTTLSRVNAFYRVTNPTTNIDTEIGTINAINPDFIDETSTYLWTDSAITNAAVPGITLPKTWRPRALQLNAATDGGYVGALQGLLLPNTSFLTLGADVAAQIIKNPRPLAFVRNNIRKRFPLMSTQWERIFSQIYKDLVILLGADLSDGTSVDGYIDTSSQYLESAMEKQLRVSQQDVTYRNPMISTMTEAYASGNFVSFNRDIVDTFYDTHELLREWK